MEYSSDTRDDVYSNINYYNPNRIRKILIVFGDMFADMNTNKTFHLIAKKLFIRERKLNISFVFITQFYFLVPKDVRLNSTHYLIINIHYKRERQVENIATNHSADIDYKDLMKIHRKYTRKPYIYLTTDSTLPSHDPLLLERIS